MRVASAGTDWVRQWGEGGDRGVGQGAGLRGEGLHGGDGMRGSGDAPMWLSAVDRGVASFLGGLDFETHTL